MRSLVPAIGIGLVAVTCAMTKDDHVVDPITISTSTEVATVAVARTSGAITAATRTEVATVAVARTSGAVAAAKTTALPMWTETPARIVLRTDGGGRLVSNTSGTARLVSTTAGSPLVVATGGTPVVARATTTIDGKPAKPKRQPFIGGEHLTLVGSYGVVPAGEMTLTVNTNATFGGNPAIKLELIAKTTGMVRHVILNVDDAGESYIDPYGLHSLGFISDQDEGQIKDYQRWDFDYKKAIATRDRTRRKGNGPVKRTTADFKLTATHVQDPASMFFYFRAFDLKVGQTLATKVFVSKKVWDLEVKVVSKDTVKVPAGTFQCLKIKPRVSLNGKVEEKGQSTIWVTDDARKMPVKIVVDVPLGSATFELKKYSPK